MGGSSMKSFLEDEDSETFQAFVAHRPTSQQESQELGQLQQQTTTYWGAQPFTSGPVYLGAIMCFLAVLAMFVVRSSDKWWLFIAFLLSIMLAWGHNFAWFADLFFNYFPGYNKFRAVSMTLVIAQLVIPMLAVLGLKAYIESEDRKAAQKALFIASGIVGGFCLLFILVPGVFLDFLSEGDTGLIGTKYDWLLDALALDREAQLGSDAKRSLLFILLAAGVLYVANIGKLKPAVVTLALAGLVLVDLYQVDLRYLNEDDFVRKGKAKSVLSPTAADQQILADPDPNFRVINLTANTFNDSKTSYFHKSIGGYHGAKLKRYQELVDSCISRTNLAVLNMLNTKYFITPDGEGKPSVRRNPLALGNAWFVEEMKMVQNADEELGALTKDDFNPANIAIIDKRFDAQLSGFQPQIDSTAFIALAEYRPNYLKYRSESQTEQLAVFSEIYFANGWNAYVDGELNPHWRANYVLRSMRIPAGKHQVEFKFEPEVYFTGEKMSFAGSFLFVLFVVGGVVLEARSKKA
jgi:hypothetical protein